MNIYLRRGVEFRDNDLMITGEALLKYTVQKHHLIVHDSDIRVIRVRQDGTCYHQQHHDHHNHQQHDYFIHHYNDLHHSLFLIFSLLSFSYLIISRDFYVQLNLSIIR